MRLFEFLNTLKNPPRIIAFPLIATIAILFAKASAIILLILIVLYAVGVASGYWVIGAFIFCVANVIIGGVFAWKIITNPQSFTPSPGTYTP